MRPIAHVAGGGRGAGVGPLVLASIIWGTTGTAQAVSHVHASSPVLGAARLLAGSTALAVFARKSGRGAARAAIARPRQRRWVLSAGIATAVYQAAFFAAVTRTGVALGTLLALGSAPIFCGLLARLLIGERVPPSWATATACAVIGSGLLLLPGAQRSADVLGIALSLLAGACYALYTVSAKRLLGSGAAPLGILVATTGTGAAILLPVLIAGGVKMATPRAALEVVHGSIAAGGKGVVFGRNIWQDPDPSRIVRAMKAIIHDGASVDQALQEGRIAA